MKIQEIIQRLETWAPPSFQESYDNSGLICGDVSVEAKGILVCLDSIEEIVDEAIELNCNLIVAHHPIVFKGLKKLTGKNYVERTLIKAIQNNIAIYAIHTNLDHVSTGVNHKIGQLLGIDNAQILSPKEGLLEKLITYCPTSQAEEVAQALFHSGAGRIGNYDSCSFQSLGTGTFRALNGAKPYVGEAQQLHNEEETKIEVIFESYKKESILRSLKSAHPYEEVAYEIYETKNTHPYVGSGMYGDLSTEMSLKSFFDVLKEQFQLDVIRHTGQLDRKVKTIAWCGGSGSFLLRNARGVKADVFITGDFKYHDFFDHENKIVIADIGHFESEQFTQQLIVDFLKENFNKFAVHLTGHNTNPVKYY